MKPDEAYAEPALPWPVLRRALAPWSPVSEEWAAAWTYEERLALTRWLLAGEPTDPVSLATLEARGFSMSAVLSKLEKQEQRAPREAPLNVWTALDYRWSAHDGWLRLDEVPFVGGRRVDALFVGCWPGTGYKRHAVEVKVSRSDWLRELRDGGKRAPAERVCHHTWVAAPSGLVKAEELPEGWGLLELAETQLRATRHAAERSVETPEWLVAKIADRARQGAASEQTVPRDVWKLAGRELTAAELFEVAEAVNGRSAHKLAQQTLRERWRNNENAREAIERLHRKLFPHEELHELKEGAVVDRVLDVLRSAETRVALKRVENVVATLVSVSREVEQLAEQTRKAAAAANAARGGE